MPAVASALVIAHSKTVGCERETLNRSADALLLLVGQNSTSNIDGDVDCHETQAGAATITPFMVLVKRDGLQLEGNLRLNLVVAIALDIDRHRSDKYPVNSQACPVIA